jgi:hypothetical protein
MKHKSLNQLICAATINGRFRDLLLRDPAQAIAAGYFDHGFSLTSEEQDFVVGIRARKLEDFAAQVYQWITGTGPDQDRKWVPGDRRRSPDLLPQTEDPRDHSPVPVFVRA